MTELLLPTTFEDVVAELGASSDLDAKLAQFVIPVDKAEQAVLAIASQVRTSGKAVFLHGAPGVGKSTFIQSLGWRAHLGFASVEQVDASALQARSLLDDVLVRLRKIDQRTTTKQRDGVVAVVINYLENLSGQTPTKVKAFFRTLNGLLRTSRLLLVWPVTDADDASAMLDYASEVSGTVFAKGREVLEFKGPPRRSWADIAENTISVINRGREISDFGLTREDLEEVLGQTRRREKSSLSIRKYLESVRDRWSERSDYLKGLESRIPRQTEVWFVFCYPRAEVVVSQFSRKSANPEEAWRAKHGELFEYVPNTQRAADWNALRLQLAIGGALTTRILYLPTNALISAVAAYGPSIPRLGANTPDAWKKPNAAHKHIATSLLARLLNREPLPTGKRRGGPAADALQQAEKPFSLLSRWVSGAGPGSDKKVNAALAKALRAGLRIEDDAEVVVEQPHPWIPNVVPDIRIDTDPSRIVCLEMNYTTKDEPGVIADYVLKKLNRYMRQLDAYLKGGAS